MSNTTSSRVVGLIIAVVAAFLVIATLAPTVDAATDGLTIVIPIETRVSESAGDVIELAKEDVPAELQGLACAVEAASQNQGSVHLGNDIYVESGGSFVLLKNVEAKPGGTVEGSGELVLGSTIVVSLKLGSDGRFSAGIDVVIDCTPTEPPPPPPPSPPPPPPPPPAPLIDTIVGCDLGTSQFVVSATNVGAVDVLVGIGWDSGNTSDDLKPGEVLTAVVPADEYWTVFEKGVPVEQGKAESCEQVSPTSIVNTTAPEVSPETLPFTGADSGPHAAFALLLVAAGALALVGARMFRTETEE